MDKALSQEEIDGVFQRLRERSGAASAQKAPLYDFRRPDRIAREQLRAIQMLHENFARSLASSLSAYLRAYVVVNVVSVEQLSFLEFAQCLPSPTVVTALDLKPFDTTAALEMNPSLVFPILEMLLGGSGVGSGPRLDREVTEIEQSVLDGIYRIALNDLRDAWSGVADMAFSIQGQETEPQMMQILAPTEAVVAIALEVRIGDNVGMMNVGMPSIVIKRLRQRFDQQWSMRKAEATEEEQRQVFELIQPARVHMDVRLEGPKLDAASLLALKPGDTLMFDYAVDRPVTLQLNGLSKYDGHIVDMGYKRGFALEGRLNGGR